MIELRTDDLRFSAAEVAAFLNDVMGLGLSNADITTLDERTEGWIVGLQMAALSLQGRSDAPAFIQAFHGSHRFILDYLVEEVLDRQPDDVQDFLCQTAVLERLTSPLCDAVTGRSDSQAILTRLERANLFLVPLDDERRWYRYHHLFADLLRSRLERSRPDQVINLHWQASAWYEEQELIVEAVMHALAARDLDRVVRLVEEHVLGLMEHGNLGILVGWLNVLPIELVRSRPWLSIARAWALAYMSSHDIAEACLQNAAQALVDGQQPSLELSDRRLAPDKVAHINGHINAIRCYIQGVTHSDPQLTIELAQRALAELPESDWRARGMVAVLLGLGYRQTMNFAAAHKALAKALAIAKATGQKYVVIDVLCQIARVEHDQGCLHQAVATCQQALRLAEEYGGFIPVVSYALSTLSGILYEWNDLAAALDFAQKSLDLGRMWGSADSLTDSYYDLIMIHIANREFDRAMESIQEMKQLYIPSGRYPRVPVALEAAVRMEMNDVTGASQRVEDLIPHTDEEWRMFNLVPVYIAQFRQRARASLEDVLGFLARTLQNIEASDATLYMIHTLAQQAMALQALGRIDEACTALRRALSMAEPEGYVRVFIGEGAPMGDLLAMILTAQRGETSLRLASYVSQLLSALGGKTPVERPATPPSSVLVEPLSDREMEVLRLLNTALPTPEIAKELFVSANTIRSHVKSIYGKLNAHGRIDALERARELKLLP
jgi:LuxR family maltose regulon positive regulatory protein